MLTKQHIQFIDKYLEDKGVYYIDIRQELTDHIATELEQKEGDFRENFTAYRTVNEKNLLKQSKKLYTLSLCKTFSYFIKVMQRPANAIFVIVMFLLCNYSISLYAPDTINYLSYTIYLFPVSFIILNKYTEKSSVPKNILHGLSFSFLIIASVILLTDIYINNSLVTAIVARYTFSFLIAVMPVAIASALRYKNYNLRLN